MRRGGQTVRLHWMVLLPVSIWGGLLVAAALTSANLLGWARYEWLPAVTIGVALAAMAARWAAWRAFALTATRHEVVVKEAGWGWSARTICYPIAHVRAITVERSLVARLIGAATLTLVLSSGQRQVYRVAADTLDGWQMLLES